MADTVATQTILDGPKYAVLKFTNISDGKGMKGNILFDATSDVLAIQLGENQSGYHDYTSFGGIPNNGGSCVTGDIKFTTVRHDSADTYTVILYLRKEY